MEQGVDHLVVHGPAVLGVGVQHERDGRVGALAVLVASFKTAFGPVEDHVRHRLSVPISSWICTRSPGRPRATAVCRPWARSGPGPGNPRFLGRIRPPKRAPAAYLTNLLRLIIRSEEHTSELQSLMRISYAVFCLKK